MDLRAAAARVALPALGLPRTPHTSSGHAGWPTTFRDPADGPTSAPRPLLPYLRWLAETQPVVFHGSRHRALTELKDERKSRDTRTYGDQTAVFASQDPVWALFFAVLRRDTMRSTYNGSLGVDAAVRGRRYFFSVDGGPELFTRGALYVLPDEGFVHEPRLAGLFDTAHRTRRGSVRPLAWFEVEPDDFPLIDRTVRHSGGQSVARALWKSGWGHRLRPRG